MSIICKIFGHKPIQPYPGFPTFCKHCKNDMKYNDKTGKYELHETAFDESFDRAIELSRTKIK
jgi:hypothetical protein